MNSRQLQYAILLAEVRNFSHVADMLEIAQPSLSKQIINLETELGVKLFNRSTTPITLTPAGEFFIEKARDLLFEEDVLLKTMERYKTGENGKLTIGVSPFRSLYLIPPIIKPLKERYPGLQIVLSEYGRAQLHKGIAEGLYDFIITNLPIDDANLEAVFLEKDTMVLAVPNHMLSLIANQKKAAGMATGSDSTENKKSQTTSIDLSDCTKLPFVVVSRGQEMRQLFDKLCKLSRLQPNIYLEVTGITTAWKMVQNGIAATLLPKQFIQPDLEQLDVTIFDIKQDAFVRQPAIVTKRGQFVSKYAQYAMELLVNR